MMRILLTNLLVAFVLSFATAQVSIDPGYLLFDVDKVEQIYIDINITNSSSEDIELFWQYEEGVDYPAEWKTQICDLNLCYSWDVFQSSALAPNTVAAGATALFTLKIENVTLGENISGSSFGILRLFDDNQFSNEVAFTASEPLSVSNSDLAKLVIFPNPTTDRFQIKSDDGVSSVSIYNIVGREVSSVRHVQGMVHDVSTLRTGMYLVRLMDDKGEVIKAMRLSKR